MEVKSTLNHGRIVKGEKIKSGCVVLEPTEEIGEHSTENGEEIIIVLEGEATIEADGKIATIGKDECAFLPQNTVHNVKNLTKNDLRYIYVVGGK